MATKKTAYEAPTPASDKKKALQTALSQLDKSFGKGVLNYHIEKYGLVAAVDMVNDDDDVILIASNGIIIRIAAEQINTVSRTSKGVRVMRVGDSDKLVTVTTAEREAEGEETENAEETIAEASAEDTSAES